ncbi:hypothetical protein OIO90_003884 [Microbotryomycetes sp. JL221]|nr:hypothetical protein OIO90_003884 [Microbotryomycetes sp. JL221]
MAALAAHPLCGRDEPMRIDEHLIRRQLANSGEGTAPTGPLSSPESAGYSCDPSTCQLPNCHCASTAPPGGLSPEDTPQFITFTSDDAIQSYTMEVLNYLLGNRTNPNGCPVKSTYFNSLTYSNYSMVTDFFVAGNEVADHTMTHVGKPNSSEILGNIRALNAYSGIPLSSLAGFRAPLLSFDASTLNILAEGEFVYDSTATAATPANLNPTDAFWPYTMDNGLANNCLDVTDVCRGQVKLPGLWEIPMYSIFEGNDTTGIHLMDPWLDTSDPSESVQWMQNTFMQHYEGNRQPFGIYSHPIHLAVGYPNVPDPIEIREAIKGFLDWLQTHDDVWFVTNQQLLAWMRNPVPASEMRTWLTCQAPDVPASTRICNGIAENQQGLLVQCPFSDFPWSTCYGCPQEPPTPDNPVPAQNTQLGVRYHLPSNCSTAPSSAERNIHTPAFLVATIGVVGAYLMA